MRPTVRPTLLMVPRLPEPFVALLSEQYDVLGPVADCTPEGLPPGHERTQALLTFGGYRTDGALMDAMPRLGLINTYGTGHEGVDLAAAQARGITVANGGDANATSVAEYAMGLVIAGSRLIVDGDRFVRAGQWNSTAVDRFRTVPGLAGRRMGIYGLGAIGHRVARRAEAFEMQIGYHGRAPHADVAYAYHDSLVGLARWADVLMVSVRAGPNNRHAVNAEVLQALGRDGYLVNVSRGLAVDEAALCEAIEQGTLLGAGLDVFENEPGVSARLRALDRVVMTPHIAAKTLLAQQAQQALMVTNLEAFFAGLPVVSAVG